VTTRRLAAEAGVNHGLVHYYFGAVEAVLVAVLDRVLERTLDRQRAALAGEGPFVARWRAALAALEAQVRSGDAALLAELAGAALHTPALRARIAAGAAGWHAVLEDAMSSAAREYGLSDAAVAPAAALLAVVLQGMAAERALAVDRGHEELERWIEGWLLALGDGGRPAAGEPG
jgi:AcrR family transcriptional regulator